MSEQCHDKYLSSAQQNVLAVLTEMQRRPVEPRSTTEITAALHMDRDKCYRALHNLAHAGFIEAAPGGNWRVAPGSARLSEQVRINLADLHHAYLTPTPQRRSEDE